VPACAATADYKSGGMSFLTSHEKPAGQYKKHSTIKQIFSPPFKFILAVRALVAIRATIRARMTIPRKVKTFVVRAAPTGSGTDTDIIRHVSTNPPNTSRVNYQYLEISVWDNEMFLNMGIFHYDNMVHMRKNTNQPMSLTPL